MAARTIKIADKPTADGIKSTVEGNAAKLDEITNFLESGGGMLENPEYGLEAIRECLAELKSLVSSGKSRVASAITGKGVTTAADAAFEVLVRNIESIVTLMQGTQDATAGAAQVLNGYTAYVKGAKINGSMPNRGAVTQSIAVNGSYTIPAGHHNGSGRVTQSIATQGAQTITPGTSDKTIAAGRYLTGAQTIKGDANLIPANIAKGKSIFGVAGSHEADGYSITYNDSGGKMNYVINQKVNYTKVRFTPVYSTLESVYSGSGRWAVLTPEDSGVSDVAALSFVDIAVSSSTGKVYPNRPLLWRWNDTSISFQVQTGPSSYKTITGANALALRQPATQNGDTCACKVQYVDAWCKMG